MRSWHAIIGFMAPAMALALANLSGCALICEPDTTAGLAPPKPAQFQSARRSLWEDHITWTGLCIVSAAAGLPDKSAAAERLLWNQMDIGDAVKPYCGDPAGEKWAALLKDHIPIAVEHIGAAKAGEASRQADATKSRYANADDIVAFLRRANPENRPVADMKLMMHDYLQTTANGVVGRLRVNWEG